MKRTRFLEFLKNKAPEIKTHYFVLLALLFATSAFLTIMLYNGVKFIKNKYRPGEIATRQLIAKKSFRYINTEATNAILAAKIKESPLVYVYHPETGASAERGIVRAFALARSYERSHARNLQNMEMTGNIFSSRLGIALEKPVLADLYNLGYNINIESHVLKIINGIYKKGVLSEQPVGGKNIEIRNGITNKKELMGYPQVFFTLDSEKGYIYYYLKTYLPFLPYYMQNDIYTLVSRLIKPDVVYSKFLTLKKIEDIKKENVPIYKNVSKGMLLVNAGELITKSKAVELNTYGSEFNLANNIPSIIGLFLLISMLLLLSYVFPYKYIRKFRASVDFGNIVFIISILAFSIVIIKAGIIFSAALSMYFPFIGRNDFYYLIPFAFGPMLIRIILNSEVSVIYIALFSILTSIIFKNSMLFMIYAFGGSFIASYEVFDFSSWSRVIKAGVVTGILNAFMVMAFALVRLNFVSVQNLYGVLMAFISGIFSAVMVIGLIPLLEKIFGFTTDFKLLELSSSNHPLLRQFSIVAPGTYQHSTMVAALAEAAASAVGANPLLARVASLYHDIGKIAKPNYFIENMNNIENPHDRLAPTMSSLIIASHVKDGQELARKYKLGTKLENIIGEHHGTSMIGAFYEKAAQEHKDENISKDSFRYSGRKPQTKEAGIIMLGDSVEAISRTMTNISPSRLELMVRKTINRIYSDGQLDECELTLKDLYAIGTAFIKVLNSVFHQRIPYAGKTIEDDDGEKGKEASNKHNEYPKKIENRPKVSPLYR